MCMMGNTTGSFKSTLTLEQSQLSAALGRVACNHIHTKPSHPARILSSRCRGLQQGLCPPAVALHPVGAAHFFIFVCPSIAGLDAYVLMDEHIADLDVMCPCVNNVKMRIVPGPANRQLLLLAGQGRLLWPAMGVD